MSAELSEIDRLRTAIAKVNDIRNSIIGCQTVNWSEHIYPLVAALEDAGIEGAGYPAARANVGTMLERTLAAEARASSDRIKALEEIHHQWRAGYSFNSHAEHDVRLDERASQKGESP